MDNSFIVKPKNYLKRAMFLSPATVGASGLMALNQQLQSDEVQKNIAKGTERARGTKNPLVYNLINDPILQPNNIQKDLNALTSDLKNVKSQQPKKEELVNEKETNAVEDIDDFKSWIKQNTKFDDETGELFYETIQGEKVPLEDSPETNVLLYEIFKQETGRGGEALEAIQNLDIEQFQQAPANAKFSDKNPFDDKFSKDLQSIRKDMGVPKNEKDIREQMQNLELQAARGMATPRDGSFLTDESRRNAAVMATRAEQLRSQLPESDKRDFYSYRRKDKSMFGFGDKGQNEFVLTPTGLTQREVYELTKNGDYEIGPAELAKEIRGDDIDREEEFMRKAILAGRVPMPGTQQQVAESKPAQEKVLIETEEQVPNNFRHKTFVPVEISGLYSRGSKDNLKFRVRMLEDKNTGEVKYVPDVNLAPIITEIYQAENYAQESKEEIGMIKDLVSADNIGLAQRVNDLSRSIAAIAGIERIAYDENGNQVMPTPEIIARWAKRFTAQNITTILGESNRTISDADRKRADDIVNVLGTFTDVAGAKLALEQLINIFETPSRNANSALQSLYAQGESSGYLNDIKDIERSVLNQLQKGGGAFSIPKASSLQFEETDETENIYESIDLTQG
jgi:hypothetical protein